VVATVDSKKTKVYKFDKRNFTWNWGCIDINGGGC
jgi:hypothetical protein